MGYEVRNHKLHPLSHHKHRHHAHTNPRNNPPPLPDPSTYANNPPIAIPYYAALQQPAASSQQLVPYASNLPVVSIDYQEQLNQALSDVRRHGRNERIGEFGAAAAGAFAMYELHEAKVDPAHARRHKMEAQLAGATALGFAGYAYHEHQEKKKSEHLVEALSGHKDTSHHKKAHLKKHSHGLW